MRNKLILLLSFSLALSLSFFFSFFRPFFYSALVLLIFTGVRSLPRTIKTLFRKQKTADIKSTTLPKGYFYFEARLNRCLQNAFYLGAVMQCVSSHPSVWLLIPFSIILFARIQNLLMIFDLFPERMMGSLKQLSGVFRLLHNLSSIVVGVFFLSDLL